MALFQQDLKDIKRLHLKKYRQQEQLFLAEGNKIVFELLQSKIKPKIIIISEDWQNSNSEIEILFSRVEQISNKDFAKISNQKNPEGILAVCEIPDEQVDLTNFNEWVIALNQLQDPGNLGTIIRIADWFGISTIVCSKNTADAYNPKVVQSTMASIARVKLLYTDLEDFFAHTQLPIYAADLQGESIYDSINLPPGILLIGNESNGIEERLKQYVSNFITIPKRGIAESLNAGVATGILVSHLLQKGKV